MEKRMLTPAETCDAVINAGITKTNLSSLQMILLGILAGMFIAIGGFVSTAASHSIQNFGMSKFVTGALFPVGLMLVIICGAELFTGNNLISVALFEGKVTMGKMLKNWILVYIGNFIGSFVFAYLVFGAGLLGLNSGNIGAAVLKTASYKGGLTFANSFTGGILCNILVCLAVWGAFASKDIVSKIFIIWFPIMAFVTSGFEHSVANMYYFSIGILAKSNDAFVKVSGLSSEKLANISWSSAFINNLIPVTLGNIVGGVVFVGLVYWIVYKYVPAMNVKRTQTVSK